MNIKQILNELVKVNQTGLETHEIEFTAEGQEITSLDVCTDMQTGKLVFDLQLNDSERLDLEDHPAFTNADRAINAEPDPGDRIFYAIYEAVGQEDPGIKVRVRIHLYGIKEDEYVLFHVDVTSIEKEEPFHRGPEPMLDKP